jgi:hypothetical protein
MQIYNALQLKKGAKADYNRLGSVTQPLQFIPDKEKTDEWAAWNVDWLEWNGLKQLRRNARRLMKNYKLAKGIIDKTDYIVSENNEMSDLVETLTQEDHSALELKFYPIIPNVINVLVSEFAKRNTKISFKAIDEYSYNELLEQKKSMVEEVLISDAQKKITEKMMEMGISPESEQGQQELSPEKLKSLPEIEDYFRTNYKSQAEQWATHLMQHDMERFKIEELEERGFRDMLITDREFWHFHMMEDDYEVELWNPVLTFYHKSPDIRYISQGNYVGKTDMMSVSDVIDKFGYLMTEDELKSLEAIYPVRSAGYPIQGYQNDGTYYDATKSHEWNTSMPSLAYRQFTSVYDNWIYNGGDIVNWILSESEDYLDIGVAHLLRVTNVYWKSQRRVGHLTKIDEVGNVETGIIGEDYKVTQKPVYDNSLFKNKNKDNLVFGEHIDWIWINDVWGGVKIGPNHPSFWGMNNPGGINPIYLGVQKNRPGRLRYQMKGDTTLYGCKLPVEGSVFSDRNTRSTSLVDLMKPFQIGYNIVNNQIADILVDELGTVILLDQNTLPRHSAGEDWGRNNLAKAYVAMKNFQMLPLDTSITNTENSLNFNHFQKLDLSQTERLMSRVQLANYFKMQAFEVVGVTPQRMGQQIGQQTATAIEQAVVGSYAQTEQYFIQHCDYLMPRVHQMRTDIAQYYYSTKPSSRLQYISSKDEIVNFQMNGTDLLLREIGVYATTKANHRAILDQIKQLAVQNNTAGASIYDLGQIIEAESMADVSSVLKKIEEKTNAQRQEQNQQEQQLAQQAQQAKLQEEQMKQQHEASEKEKDRQKDILVAEIRAAGYGSMMDLNKNEQSDYQDAMKEIRQTEQYQQQTSLQREKQNVDQAITNSKLEVEREKINADREIAEKQLQIARENKNRYDVKK